MDRLKNKVIDLTKSNLFFNKIIYSLLNSDVLTTNPVYTYLYNKQMKTIMERHENVPLKVIIENTNVCNANCIHCIHSKMSRKTGFMGFSLYKKIVNDCVSLKVKEIAIYRLGEPLLDPNFSEKVIYAKKVGIETVSTNTNASLLNEENAIKILNSGLDIIYISLDATSKDLYERIRKGLNYNTVEKNIKRFIELRDFRNQEKPIVILNFCVMEENKSQVKDFIKKWKRHVEQIWISDIHDWLGEVKMKSKALHRRTAPCRLLWTEMVISWNGKVPLCCVDYDDEIIIGDLKNESVKDVWSGEKLEKYRKIQINRDFNKIPLCKSCTCYFSWWMHEWEKW